jgi:hypothetical protein
VATATQRKTQNKLTPRFAMSAVAASTSRLEIEVERTSANFENPKKKRATRDATKAHWIEQRQRPK